MVLHQGHPDLLDHLVLRVHPARLEGTVQPADPVRPALKAIPVRIKGILKGKKVKQ
jgi:hypothetical protein